MPPPALAHRVPSLLPTSIWSCNTPQLYGASTLFSSSWRKWRWAMELQGAHRGVWRCWCCPRPPAPALHSVHRPPALACLRAKLVPNSALPSHIGTLLGPGHVPADCMDAHSSEPAWQHGGVCHCPLAGVSSVAPCPPAGHQCQVCLWAA